MATLKVRTRMGDETSLKENTIQEFGQSLRGELIQPGDASYNEARPESCHLCLRVSHYRRNLFNHGHRRSTLGGGMGYLARSCGPIRKKVAM